METLIAKIEDLAARFKETKRLLDIDKLSARRAELRLLMSEPDFWNQREEAVRIGQEAEEYDRATREWLALESEISETLEMARLAQAEDGQEMLGDLEKKYESLSQKFSSLEFQSFFSESYDRDNALLSIHAGTGGVDAQDWAEILERMYLRYCERQGWKAETLDRSYGNEAGIKSVVLRISGTWAYGYLKSENGVHRLLRNSPFDADGARHTSFALVEVIPEIKDSEAVPLKDEDLRIDVYRSSGPGGQSVNTTDSAVRVVHLPSGITVACQSERSQHQNKENALKILRTRLYQKALEEKEAAERKLKGEVQKAEWGRQIRSYFLYGKRLIKDHRSDYETGNVEPVLEGKLDDFIEAYLRWLKS